LGSRSDIPTDKLLGGKIRLIQRIGRGGMGDVWVARNEATQAEVAVKTLAATERTPLHDERFRREARIAATISHRNVVRVFDLVDEPDGTLGLVMELLRGGTLEEAMRERGPFTGLQAVALALPILSAMHHVHQKGIVHRDMKPGNVFFAVEPDGHVIPKILDFGIAKIPAAGSALTIDGNVLGTPHYMSPEQIRANDDIDGRSDMFSFATVLYEILTGVRVFHRDTAAASLAAVLEHDVDPDPRIEPRLWLAMSRALAKRPYERHATCADFADALRVAAQATDDQLATALQELRPTTQGSVATTNNASNLALSTSSPRPPRKPWGVVAGVFGALAAVALGIGVTFGRASSASERSMEAASARIHEAPLTVTSTLPVDSRDAIPPVDAKSEGVKPAASKPAEARPREPKPVEPRATAKRTWRPAAPATSKPPKGVATTPGF
jgi:eukaryotic-like serine/threonine-protein kinase